MSLVGGLRCSGAALGRGTASPSLPLHPVAPTAAPRICTQAPSRTCGTLVAPAASPAASFASTSSVDNGLSLATDVLRPRRLSAPVIARLIRSATTLQDLADVVQQQAPYLDVPLLGVALLHLALLHTRSTQQPQPTSQQPQPTSQQPTSQQAQPSTSQQHPHPQQPEPSATTSTTTTALAAPTASTLRTLLSLVFAQMELDALSGPDLANVLTALGALGAGAGGGGVGQAGAGGAGAAVLERPALDRLLGELGPRLYQCKAQDLANVMCAVALLRAQPDPGFRSFFLAAVRKQARRMAPRDLAMTLWAYGAIGTDVQEEAVQLLLERGRAKLQAFSALHLAKAAQGLAALQYRPPPEWVEAFCEALRPALRRTSSRELCALLLALARLQVGLDATTRATLLVHTFSALPSMAPSELALSVWALGRLTANDLPALIDLDMSGRVLAATYDTLTSFSAGELQQLLEGLTRLAVQPPLEWMQAYVAALGPRLGDLDAQQLAGVLGSLAAQQYRPDAGMQEVVLAATQANMQQLLADTTCTAALVTALRRLSIEPPAAWVAALLAASRAALKNRCTDLHLANLAGSLAAWGVRPDGRWTARLMWRSQVLMTEDRMSPRALVALLQAMVSLGLRPNPTWLDLCLRTAAARASQPSFEPHHYGTLLASLHALGAQPPQEWLTRMLLSTYRCWDRLTVTHWSSLLPALVLLQARPPREWLRRFEALSGPRLAGCSALQLLALAVALSQLHGLAAAGAAAGAGAGAAKGGAASPTAAAVPASASAGAAAHEPHVPSPPPPPPATAATTTTTATTATATATAALPSAAWRQQWWAASSRLLGRVRYAPSELLLTAQWLGALGWRPTPEWLQACADVAARYAKVMERGERAQLAAAIAPLLE